ncbi:hypothetical protein [Novosphingobium sp.]|uniref:hypothetical protein n=1 Tax=Novosphingobium sp. TaxID=1874826 RepID=UPI0027372363|nr:hypothetical protein [Novosphingobium sp.]MDP3907740.1 hypothetical protein [Novosphingobium sp.]
MSKQLTWSAAVSVLAMAAIALLATDLPGSANLISLPKVGYSAEAAVLPQLGNLLPALQ